MVIKIKKAASKLGGFFNIVVDVEPNSKLYPFERYRL